MVPVRKPEILPASLAEQDYPENPVLVRSWRGGSVESQHRGSWIVADSWGRILEGAGAWDKPVFVRSSVKSLQALPLLETGAAERFRFSDPEVALALASHDAEPCHTEVVAGVLERLSLSVGDLKCGPQPPGDAETRAKLRADGLRPTGLHNNCSGKHAGFLALARHLGVDPAEYIDASSPGQVLVRDAVREMSGALEGELTTAIDGCSAPTFRMPLRGLAVAFARMANPENLPGKRRDACERMLRSVASHPVLIAGSRGRLCTEIARTSGGRLFPKIGGDAVYGIGVRGADRGLAVKMDDGSNRGLHALVVALLRRFGFADGNELAALSEFEHRSIRNWAGLETGRTEVLV
jgi:L-asparaginase II